MLLCIKEKKENMPRLVTTIRKKGEIDSEVTIRAQDNNISLVETLPPK